MALRGILNQVMGGRRGAAGGRRPAGGMGTGGMGTGGVGGGGVGGGGRRGTDAAVGRGVRTLLGRFRRR